MSDGSNKFNNVDNKRVLPTILLRPQDFGNLTFAIILISKYMQYKVNNYYISATNLRLLQTGKHHQQNINLSLSSKIYA